ncbi:hypothetical protein GCM10010472_18860 [Pseudonocardia halophobica]|uniref:Three-Cys-motif partner protein n=1 Tax=Pseudonocardia halophobica TaxID=29401 RepID=A0A9W6KZB0_9PSEU|nr:three-Cys-motif partner protein TcmP [Pseudonocardia halophobica]GLL09900.1 hypothetical protein GCM10017577_10400 [Pseudonocardia halophobica]
MSLLWKLEPATEAKHRLNRSYLDAWWPIMLQPSGQYGYERPRVTYVDAFAGPGKYLDGEDGSPVFALDRLLNHTARDRMNLRRDRVYLIFIEKDKDRCAHLRTLLIERFGQLEQLPVTVIVREGEAATATPELLTQTRAWDHPILAIFDSWGNVNIPFELVGRIAGVRSGEVITTFGPNWFSRRESQDPSELDRVFGGNQYWQPAEREARPDERWRAWLETYRDSLKRAGFPYQLQFRVTPRTGQPLHLVFGTSSDKGVEVMKDAMWKVDGEEGMSFHDPRTREAVPAGQMDLFREHDHHAELSELICQCLAPGEKSVEDVREWLLRETARWRRKDAISALSKMRERNVVQTEPNGRIVRSSKVRLL